jgi:hypothetical protein
MVDGGHARSDDGKRERHHADHQDVLVAVTTLRRISSRPVSSQVTWVSSGMSRRDTCVVRIF